MTEDGRFQIDAELVMPQEIMTKEVSRDIAYMERPFDPDNRAKVQGEGFHLVHGHRAPLAAVHT